MKSKMFRRNLFSRVVAVQRARPGHPTSNAKIKKQVVVKAIEKSALPPNILMQEGSDSPRAILMQIALGKSKAKMIGIVAELGIADLLADGIPKTAAVLASLTNMNQDGLHRGLRMLATFGVLNHNKDNTFSLTPDSGLLMSSAKGSMRKMMVFWSQPWHDLAHSYAMHSIKTGEPTFTKVYGKPVFEWLSENPQQAKTFNEAFSDFSAAKGAAVAAAYPFKKYKQIVDIGGGHGALLAAVLKTAPKAHGILCDPLDARESARVLLNKAGVLNRVDIRTKLAYLSPGVLPKGADMYILKHVLHAFEDTTCLSLLSEVAKAMNPHGRVLILEYLVSNVHRGAIFDMEMLVTTLGGKERTADEFKDLMDRSGLSLFRIIPTKSPLVILEAEKAPAPDPQFFFTWQNNPKQVTETQKKSTPLDSQ
jgi:hypothetical protein